MLRQKLIDLINEYGIIRESERSVLEFLGTTDHSAAVVRKHIYQDMQSIVKKTQVVVNPTDQTMRNNYQTKLLLLDRVEVEQLVDRILNMLEQKEDDHEPKATIGIRVKSNSIHRTIRNVPFVQTD